MFHHKFPVINHIDQIREAIEGYEEFYIAEREFGYVCNYMVQMPGSFLPKDPLDLSDINNALLRRECRGIVFNHEGRVIARRFHKFFNVGEKEEVFPQNIGWDKHEYFKMDKLDGSMITPIPMPDGSIRWGTKMGLTEVAIPVEKFVVFRNEYVSFAQQMLAANHTPIFEWCSRKQRIVIDYPEDTLKLTAIRDNIRGTYAPLEVLKFHSVRENIPLADYSPIYFKNHKEYEQWYDTSVAELDGTEGFVIRFCDGNMVKVKTPWYKRLHKAKEDLVHEKNVVEMLVREQVDDLKDALLDHDLQALEQYEKSFMEGLLLQYNCIGLYLEHMKQKYVTKKEFALSDEPQWPRSIVFKMWDRPIDELMPHLKQVILSHVSSQSKVDSIRWLWGGAKWNYGTTDLEA